MWVRTVPTEEHPTTFKPIPALGELEGGGGNSHHQVFNKAPLGGAGEERCHRFPVASQERKTEVQGR